MLERATLGTPSFEMTSMLKHTARRAGRLPLALALSLGLAAAPPVAAPLAAQRPTAAEPGSELTVTLVTMGVGDMVWERFGHNAIWISDPVAGTNLAYNWGLFDFQQPFFIPRFLAGRMLYSMAPEEMRSLVEEYGYRNRTVWAQELALTPAQKLELKRFVEWNARPENRDYAYDYYRDNCSTRVRDVLDRVLGGRIKASSESFSSSTTYRWYTRRAMTGDPLIYTGIQLALGRPADRPLTRHQEMFLPEKLQEYIRHVKVPDGKGGETPLVSSERVILPSSRAALAPVAPTYLSWYLGAGLAIAVVLVLLAWGGAVRGVVAVGALWSLVAGVAGVLLILTWITRHVFMHWNENLLLFNPVSLVALVPLLRGLRQGRLGPNGLIASLVAAGLALLGAATMVLPVVGQRSAELAALAVPAHFGLAAALLILVGNRQLHVTRPHPARMQAQGGIVA